MNEFEIIQHYFAKQTNRSDVELGTGDDAAIVNIPHDQSLAITTDTLVSDVHFLANTSPFDIGYKSLAVSLSDLAAMGATPAWITVNLTLPDNNNEWLASFSEGLYTLANSFDVQLIGGDLTKGPLTISVQAYGLLPKNQALKRSGAKIGDLICVTNTLGDAALGLLISLNKINVPEKFKNYLVNRLHQPEPQIKIGKQLLKLATAAIDISDGLVGDLKHLLKSSQVGACIYVDRLPLSLALSESVSYDQAINLALGGGDDYELCFTIPKEKVHELDFVWTCIGSITQGEKLDILNHAGDQFNLTRESYQHFSS